MPPAIRLVESVADADRVDVPDPSKVAYLTQTTLSIDDAARIIERLTAAIPPNRRTAASGHLLCHTEPTGGGAAAGCRV